MIPPFDKIWERDKTKTKDQATKEIKYIYFLCDFESPYRKAYSAYDVERIVREDFIKDPNWKPDEIILNGVKKYEEFQNTITTRILASARTGAEKLARYFEEVDFGKLDKMGKPLYTAKDLASNLSSVGNIIKSLINLEKQVQSEQLDQSNVRGKTMVNDYEIPA